MTAEEPRDLLVQARGEPSPLYEPQAGGFYDDLGTFTRNVPLDDPRLVLPANLADVLRSWSLSRPPEGFTSRPELRKHVKQGLTAARRLAGHLGPSRAVCYWDERHKTSKWVCWSCDRLHWERDSHGRPPPPPVHITVEGEFKFGPLRAEGFGDFAPDDPAAALALSDDLVAGLYTWAKNIDTTLNLDLRDREEGKYDDEWQRLFREGHDLAQQVAHELGPERTVTYKGLANGGPAALRSVTWQGDQEL
ncbi:hypothetical protein OG372_25420 [Streptomyces sp. NBC_01020]|uniref:hypothetical protein n=1 Tax=unclassified Streptomyces TaxID=2593676 RepID=UPI002E1A641E|nr:hypothetical protein OG372_25420 [Streptomyces sp. NBC_01020]WSX67226.1 hypothetical protein OG221_11705 [Streptomyces sp. NBC_00932]